MTKTEIAEALQRAHSTLTKLINDLPKNPFTNDELTNDEMYRLLKIDTDATNLAMSITSLIKILQPKEENDSR